MEILAPNGTPSGAVLVIHSWWGLTDAFRSYGSSLTRAGYLTGLADLFDGEVAETEAEARALRAKPRKLPMYKSLSADIDALRSAAGSTTVKVGIVGFSMGGHWAVWLSQRPEYAIAATVLYYAARGGSFQSCRADILAHFAETDPWVSGSARKTMERAIGKSGCKYLSYDYPGTSHWFAETNRGIEYDRASATLALERDLQFFRDRLSV